MEPWWPPGRFGLGGQRPYADGEERRRAVGHGGFQPVQACPELGQSLALRLQFRFPLLWRGEDIVDEVGAEHIAEPGEQVPGLARVRVGRGPHAETEFGVVLEQ